MPITAPKTMSDTTRGLVSARNCRRRISVRGERGHGDGSRAGIVGGPGRARQPRILHRRAAVSSDRRCPQQALEVVGDPLDVGVRREMQHEVAERIDDVDAARPRAGGASIAGAACATTRPGCCARSAGRRRARRRRRAARARRGPARGPGSCAPAASRRDRARTPRRKRRALTVSSTQLPVQIATARTARPPACVPASAGAGTSRAASP